MKRQARVSQSASNDTFTRNSDNKTAFKGGNSYEITKTCELISELLSKAAELEAKATEEDEKSKQAQADMKLTEADKHTNEAERLRDQVAIIQCRLKKLNKELEKLQEEQLPFNTIHPESKPEPYISKKKDRE